MAMFRDTGIKTFTWQCCGIPGYKHLPGNVSGIPGYKQFFQPSDKHSKLKEKKSKLCRQTTNKFGRTKK